jgi:hypothetical protein
MIFVGSVIWFGVKDELNLVFLLRKRYPFAVGIGENDRVTDGRSGMIVC